MASKQKTARFAAVVAKAGRPRVHLTFLAAVKDSELQSALKAHRVMSVVSFITGTKKDYGLAGYVEELASQVFIFPKPLKAFDDRRIVGINYDLLAAERAAPARKVRRQAAGAEQKKAPQVFSRRLEPNARTATPREAGKKKPPRAAGTTMRKESPVRRTVPKPPKLKL